MPNKKDQELKEIKGELEKIRKQQHFNDYAGSYGCLGFIVLVLILTFIF